MEKELTTLGSMCAASLLNEDTILPFAGMHLLTRVLESLRCWHFFHKDPYYFTTEELTVSPEDAEKADMRIVQAAAEEVSLFF